MAVIVVVVVKKKGWRGPGNTVTDEEKHVADNMT